MTGTVQNVSYLTLTNVCKQYRTGDICVDALKDASFTVENGEFVVVLGSSGAGKTTLLNLLIDIRIGNVGENHFGRQGRHGA